MSNQTKDFEFYLANKEKFLNEFLGRFIVIKDGIVLGNYSTALEAVQKTKIDHEMGTFIVQHVTQSGDTAIFRTRVAG